MSDEDFDKLVDCAVTQQKIWLCFSFIAVMGLVGVMWVLK